MQFIVFIAALLGGGSNLLAAGKMIALSNEQVEDLCQDKTSSNQVEIGTEVIGIHTKTSWGQIVSRLPDNKGWKLSTGNKVLDANYGKKWEIGVAASKDGDANKLFDGDGKEILGDHDHLWFKSEPPESDTEAQDLYVKSDLKRGVSTDGLTEDRIALIYYNRGGKKDDVVMTQFPLRILQYLTQTKPQD